MRILNRIKDRRLFLVATSIPQQPTLLERPEPRILLLGDGLLGLTPADPRIEITLANDPDGQTSDGKDYLDLTDATDDGSLDPGESVMVRMYFRNPFRLRFTFELGIWGVLS